MSDLDRILLEEFLDVMCGATLGAGVSRTVFVLAHDMTKVVKLEKETDERFQNVTEWRVWQDAKGTPLERYLAPCHSISPNGRVLVMDRAMPLPTLSEARVGGSTVLKNVMLPDVLTDTKPENYGILRGRIVCVDYGSCLALNHGCARSKLRKVKWW